MRVYDIIEAKKRRRELTDAEIGFFVKRVADGSATEEQIAAFCMAVLLNGMTKREAVSLTLAMADSGKKTPRPPADGIFADKHSTGGVSDSTTLVLVPVLASLGVKCAKYSGRGLGHTGGTLDKLESFRGLTTALSPQEFAGQAVKIGAVIAGQTEETVPADKRMYAVRDLTATVDSIPLIASSVMSKKLASFSDVILLDVKYGDGAFMRTASEAEKLASLMVGIGSAAGRKTCAAVTRMDSPLGDAIGCNAEVREAVGVLQGKISNDLSALSFYHCEKILEQAEGIAEEEAKRRVKEAVASGRALDKLAEMVGAQGGDPRDVYEAEKTLPLAKNERRIEAKKDGYLKISALALGRACLEMGGGREKAGAQIDHEAAILLGKRAGEFVRRGETLATLYYNDKEGDAYALAESAFSLSDKRIRQRPLVHSFTAGR